MRIVVVCAALLSATPAVAQTYEALFKTCYASDLPDRVIASCSALISRRLAEGQDLATAFKNRGNAYDDKGDHDRAIADFGAALAINAQDADAFNSRGTT
jgi:lipoprotein NlpI